ncbi:sugar transporter [Desulfovibrio sp. OttesenSCG-928-C06]|nr:sugar transporter [Desulfovibrio sp. OttesenSCG-928-C06]
MWKSTPQHSWKAWLPTVSLSFAAFIFVTSEFIPVGLLPDIAAGLGQTEAQTGLMVTAYAWVVALMSLPLTVLSARWERRRLMLILLCVFIAGHALCGIASSFGFLMAARICIALAHAVFWAITTPLAARMAPEGKRGRALGIIVAGTSLATILGVPLGTMLGHALGWRMSFLAIGVVAIVVLAVIARLLPLLPSTNAGSLKSLPQLARRPALLVTYLLTALTVTAHFAPFTYINPFLQQVGGFSPTSVVILLLFLGSSGIPGSWIGGKYADSAPGKAMTGALAAMTICLAVLAPLCMHFSSVIGIGALCIVWGTSMTVAGLIYQTRVLTLASDATDVAISIYSGIFNVGIGGGALLGSRIITGFSMEDVGYAGAIFAFTGLVVCLISGLRFRAKRKKDASAGTAVAS